MKSVPTVLVTTDGGIADVSTTPGIRVVMIDYDCLKSGDMTDEELQELATHIKQLKADKGLPKDMREELDEALHVIEETSI